MGCVALSVMEGLHDAQPHASRVTRPEIEHRHHSLIIRLQLIGFTQEFLGRWKKNPEDVMKFSELFLFFHSRAELFFQSHLRKVQSW